MGIGACEDSSNDRVNRGCEPVRLGLFIGALLRRNELDCPPGLELPGNLRRALRCTNR